LDFGDISPNFACVRLKKEKKITYPSCIRSRKQKANYIPYFSKFIFTILNLLHMKSSHVVYSYNKMRHLFVFFGKTNSYSQPSMLNWAAAKKSPLIYKSYIVIYIVLYSSIYIEVISPQISPFFICFIMCMWFRYVEVLLFFTFVLYCVPIYISVYACFKASSWHDFPISCKC
jgi:hypothetical protein